ncbi:MAG: alpha/beta fold hydrolase [Flammeovirgaceae bacterium]
MKNWSTILYRQTYIDRGNGPTVVLLHGLFGNVKQWLPVVEGLCKNYRVLVPRLPIVDSALAPITINQLLTILHEFIEWHQLSNITLVGHAVGGQLALFYTHRHPSIVEKLVLVSSNGLLDKNLAAEAGSLSPTSFDFISQKVHAAFHQPNETVTELATEIYELVQSVPKRLALTSLLQSSLHSKVSSFLTKINLPVLLVWGLQDQINPPRVALHFHDLLPNSTIKFIDNCGHVPMLENPNEFVDAVQHFLKANQ